MPVLTRLINKSFCSGVFPDCLKKATIIPLYKKGDKFKMENYRPISLLPYLSKIFEKCLYARIYNFFTTYDLFSHKQFGFLHNKSATDALLSFTEYQYSVLNSKDFSINIFVDFVKAFDLVQHDILLRKFYRYGVRGLPHELISSYLSDRKQIVKNGDYFSSECAVRAGVPQGSVLGPLFS